MSDFAETMPLPPPPPEEYGPPRKKRRWPWVLVVLAVLVVGAGVAGELWARSSVETTVRAQAIEALGLPEDQQIDVQTQGLVLPQVLRGTLTSLSATSENVPLGPVVANVSASGTDIPIQAGEPIGSIAGTIVVTQEELLKLVDEDSIPIDHIVIADGKIIGQAQFKIQGLTLPASVTLGLSVEDGSLMIMPISADAMGLVLDAQMLREVLGDLGGDLLGPYPVCIAEHLPKAVTVTGITLAEGTATVDMTVDGNITTDQSLAELGVCS